MWGYSTNTCNYCTFQRILQRAELQGRQVITESKNGGVQVYVVPKELGIRPLTKAEESEYFAAWFMALPGHCCC